MILGECVCRGRVAGFGVRGVMNEIISSLIATIPRVSLTEGVCVQNLVNFCYRMRILSFNIWKVYYYFLNV
jgi:hypothetical protein